MESTLAVPSKQANISEVIFYGGALAIVCKVMPAYRWTPYCGAMVGQESTLGDVHCLGLETAEVLFS